MKLRLMIVFLLLAVTALAQAPPSTNAAQFQVSMNFLGGQPYGQASALSTAFTTQFTTNVKLRADVLAMPGAGYTGFLGGAQYDLCAIKPIETFLSTTSLSCGKIEPYVNGAGGLGRVQLNGATTQSVAALGRFGMNYDPTGTSRFTLNLIEAGWGHFGPTITGQRNNGFFFQSGIAVGLGTSAAATQAKTARMSRSYAKKLKKLNMAIQKAQKG
jgi:hypothetical protein